MYVCMYVCMLLIWFGLNADSYLNWKIIEMN